MDAFTLVARLTLNKSEFDSSFKSIETDINSDKKKSTFSAWGVAVGTLAARAFSKAFSAASGFAKSIIMTGMDFDSMMSEVKAVGNMTEEQFEQVRQRAIDLGATTKFTSKEVGEAFYYMGLAGWDSEEMLAGISGVLDLAAASGENLGSVSDIVTDAITAMGLTADDTARFVNVLAAASTNSNTTVAMMGEAFKYLATTGGVLEYSIEDVASVLGLLANNGIKATQAGTSMRQILNTLINPSDKAAKAMSALGISLFEVGTDKRKPLMQVVEELRDVFAKANFNLEGFNAEELQNALNEIDAWYDQEEKKIQQGYDNGDYKKKTYTALMKDLEKIYNEKFKQVYGPNEWFLGKLGDIGGLRGISSLFALMNSTNDDVNQLVQAVNTSSEGNGAAKDMAETMIDNLEGDITLLNSALDGLKILMSDTYKEPLREFVQTFTEEIGKLSEAFSEGGISGMLINLTDWIINGITNTLSNPDITVDSANKFGAALGDFVGHLISKLITSAPEVLNGLFTAGLNLADGLISGLFAGLFGTGEGSVYGLISNIQEEEKDAIEEAEKTSIKANGIVSYMDSLVAKYGDAATNTAEWAEALAQLEEVMPGVTREITSQYNSASAATEAMRLYIDGQKELAIEQAKQAALNQYRENYEGALAELGTNEIQRDLAKAQMDYVRSQLVDYVMRMDAARAEKAAQEGYSYNAWDRKDVESLDFKALTDYAYQAANYLGESQDDIVLLNKTYEEQEKVYREHNGKVGELTTKAEQLKRTWDLADAAYQQATAAALAMAERTNSAGTAGYPQAKGDWYVPYDDYPSLLHRGEMVLTASQARQYRNGSAGADIDLNALQTAVVAAVREGMRNAQVTAYMNGRRVTDEVSRMMASDMVMRR